MISTLCWESCEGKEKERKRLQKPKEEGSRGYNGE